MASPTDIHAHAKRTRAPRLTPAERRGLLIAAALSVLADEGLGHSTHSLVAARAGVALPTVLHYYPEHAELVDAALGRVADFLLNGIAARVASTVSNPAVATEEMLVRFARSIEEDQDTVRVWLDWSTATRHHAWPKYLAFRNQACAIVADLLRKGQEDGSVARGLAPDEAAQVVVGLAHMIAQMHFSGASLGQIQRVIHQLLGRYLQPGQE